ncbi:MAG: hypothetical protein R3B84_23065 [Zavarzinella sp.]
MDEQTEYRNTDLDLTSPDDLTALAEQLEKRGLALMRRVVQISKVEWFCGFSWGGGWFTEAEQSINSMLSAVESLEPQWRSAWDASSLRVFDIGYDCREEPFAFRQQLSTETLSRLAAVGATLRWTLYADRNQPYDAEESSPSE